MSASRPIDELRRQAANLIVDRLRTANVASVASDLGISRQAVYDIRKGKYAPSLALVHKACEVWRVTFSFRGMLIDSTGFKTPSSSLPPAIQGSLLGSLDQLDSRNFEVVAAKPMGKALEITIRLTVPEPKLAQA